MHVEIIETPGLGDRSYVVSHDRVAIVIDPQRDLDRVYAKLSDETSVTHVLETHVHNDYVTGGLELARRCGAAYVLSAADPVTFDRVGVSEGDMLGSGELRVEVMETPGHTPHHVAYVVSCGGQRAVFTGGSLLYGTVGRTDLIGEEMTEELSRHQHRTARRLTHELPSEAAVCPTHGFGSFCASAGSGEGRQRSTIGEEIVQNVACTAADEDAFVQVLLAGLDAYPRYYAHMAPVNRAGPAPLDLSPPHDVAPGTLEKRRRAGEWIVDVRARSDFAAAHLPGSVNVELADQLATYLGWILPWGTPVTFLADDAEATAEAQRMVARIGIDRPAGRAVGDLESHLGGMAPRSYPLVDFPELARVARDRDTAILDVRRNGEWREHHLADALHIPLHELSERMHEVPVGEVWVHCKSGYRAAIAASLLDAAGRSPVLIDDDYDRASEVGMALVFG